MSPRSFDRLMVEIEIGSNPKIGRLTDRQFRTLICGVWPLAAKANPRGYLVVAGQAATVEDVAYQARCTAAVAALTLARLRELNMLEFHEDVGLEYCHDWHLLNPDPRSDPTATERQRRKRERDRNGNVTRDSHANVTNVTQTEVEVEVEVKKNTNAERRSAVADCFAYWQEKCGHPQAKLTADRRGKIEHRLRDGYTVEQIHVAIDGAARAAFINDAGKRFDDIELICRSGSKLEDFMGRDGNVVAFNPDVPDFLRPSPAWSAQLDAHLQRQRGESA